MLVGEKHDFSFIKLKQKKLMKIINKNYEQKLWTKIMNKNLRTKI